MLFVYPATKLINSTLYGTQSKQVDNSACTERQGSFDAATSKFYLHTSSLFNLILLEKEEKSFIWHKAFGGRYLMWSWICHRHHNMQFLTPEIAGIKSGKMETWSICILHLGNNGLNHSAVPIQFTSPQKCPQI